jgi:hypothetical protein
MAPLNDTTIEHLATRVLARTLPASEWTHEGHFAAALWFLRHRPELTTPGGMREVISAYNQSTGKPNTDASGYHHTITRASIGAAAAELASHPPAASLHAVLADLMASRLGHPDWLLAHWRRETLFSAQARRSWVAPDLAGLSFTTTP